MGLSLLLLLTVTAAYSGYNLLIKVSTSHVPGEVTSTVLGTICLQLAALAVSTCYALVLLARGGHVLTLPRPAWGWAIAAGLCIGVAEVAYFYLFRGVGGAGPMTANVAVPVIVAGTIAVTLLVSYFVLQETLTGMQLLGCGLIGAGVVALLLGRGLPPV